MISVTYLERNRSGQLSATCHIIANLSLVVLCNIMRLVAARRSYGGRIDCGAWEILQMNARAATGKAMCCVAVQHVAYAAFAGHCVLQKNVVVAGLACMRVVAGIAGVECGAVDAAQATRAGALCVS